MVGSAGVVRVVSHSWDVGGYRLRVRRRVLSIVFRKIVSGKMKFCAGRSGEGAAKPRLGASEHVPAALSRVPRQRHSSE